MVRVYPAPTIFCSKQNRSSDALLVSHKQWIIPKALSVSKERKAHLQAVREDLLGRGLIGFVLKRHARCRERLGALVVLCLGLVDRCANRVFCVHAPKYCLQGRQDECRNWGSLRFDGSTHCGSLCGPGRSRRPDCKNRRAVDAGMWEGAFDLFVKK